MENLAACSSGKMKLRAEILPERKTKQSGGCSRAAEEDRAAGKLETRNEHRCGWLGRTPTARPTWGTKDLEQQNLNRTGGKGESLTSGGENRNQEQHRATRKRERARDLAGGPKQGVPGERISGSKDLVGTNADRWRWKTKRNLKIWPAALARNGKNQSGVHCSGREIWPVPLLASGRDRLEETDAGGYGSTDQLEKNRNWQQERKNRRRKKKQWNGIWPAHTKTRSNRTREKQIKA
jgi:hypothetical protein